MLSVRPLTGGAGAGVVAPPWVQVYVLGLYAPISRMPTERDTKTETASPA